MIKCCNCKKEKMAEECLVDEYDEIWCQDCWDNLPEDETEDSTTRPLV